MPPIHSQVFEVTQLCSHCGDAPARRRCACCGTPMCTICYDTQTALCRNCPTEEFITHYFNTNWQAPAPPVLLYFQDALLIIMAMIVRLLRYLLPDETI